MQVRLPRVLSFTNFHCIEDFLADWVCISGVLCSKLGLLSNHDSFETCKLSARSRIRAATNAVKQELFYWIT